MSERTDLQREERIAAERGDVETREAPTTSARTTTARETEDTTATAATRDTTTAAGSGDTGTELLAGDALTDFRTRWDQVQVRFVDQPREAVQSAHDLVGELVERLSQSFTKQRDDLESSWGRGEDDTEALRLALQRYRSFFNRLLST